MIFVTLQKSTLDLREYPTAEMALAHSVELSRLDSEHSTFIFYELRGPGQLAAVCGELHRLFGTDTYRWVKKK